MKTTLLALVLVTNYANAAPLPDANIANMVAQNDFVMSGGACAVANGARPKKTDVMVILLGGTVHRIPSAAAYDIASPGYTKNKKTGKYLMSERLAAACKKDKDSDGCVYSRSRWSQEPLGIHPPGNLK